MIEFQSAHPVRGATITPSMFTLVSAYFNPRAPCGARQTRIEFASDNIKFQSTRPVWGATYRGDQPVLYREFQSTRPVWGATGHNLWVSCWKIFQSTRPVWGATAALIVGVFNPQNFNPRAPCGARRGGRLASDPRDHISIHAPRVGRDHFVQRLVMLFRKFQSTRPVWGATVSNATVRATRRHFNPRAPCGARQQI